MRCPNRLAEWMAASALAGMGAHILVSPEALSESRLAAVLDLVWPPRLSGLIYFVTGATRIGALVCANRLGWLSAYIRAVGAAAGGLIWLQMALALLLFSGQWNISVSPAIWLYMSAATAEFVSTYRARADAAAHAVA